MIGVVSRRHRTAASAAARVGFACPPGYGAPITITDSLSLERVQTGISSGAYTAEEYTALVTSLDVNGDGKLCFKPVSNLRGQSTKSWGSYYLADDNNQP